MKTILALGLCSLLVTTAYAEVKVKDYKALMASRDAEAIRLMKAEIRGLGEGIGWANAKVKIYCQPDNLALGVENYIDILDREIEFENHKGTDMEGNWYIGSVLLSGLQRTFPCTDKK